MWSNVAKTGALGLIKAYQYGVRPMLGQRCRFFPSCSEYTAEAIELHGVIKGSGYGAMRLCKCHPWHEGGLDPVPPKRSVAPATSESAQLPSTFSK
ncbi:MAG: membrane protein insertion efficiency factor YidD [Betaproteobacteria bacterium]|nr:MAG: membrane protein insertion efficiency factor YidD [Betaproteobacteria bacterium]